MPVGLGQGTPRSTSWHEPRDHPNPSMLVDGRVTVAELTDQGQGTMEAAAPDHVASVRDSIIDVLDEEQLGHLQEICDAVLARIGTPDGTRNRDVTAGLLVPSWQSTPRD
jgi:hypothetical protein